MLGLWLFSGYYFSTRVSDVEHEATTINSRYMNAQELLSTVRAQVLLASGLGREGLLDPNPGSAGAYRRQRAESFAAGNAAPERSFPVRGRAAESEHVQQLRREIDQFRD